MSNSQHPNAKLRGYTGPIYPSTITQLPFMGATRTDYENYCRLLIWFQYQIMSLKTQDGYIWYCAMSFELEFGKIVLLAIPWAKDWNLTNGTQNDRSPAIYTKGAVSEKDIEMFLERLASAR